MRAVAQNARVNARVLAKSETIADYVNADTSSAVQRCDRRDYTPFTDVLPPAAFTEISTSFAAEDHRHLHRFISSELPDRCRHAMSADRRCLLFRRPMIRRTGAMRAICHANPPTFCEAAMPSALRHVATLPVAYAAPRRRHARRHRPSPHAAIRLTSPDCYARP